MDIDSKKFQIELNTERLKEEYDRYNEIRSRIGYISIIYTAFSIYTIPLIEFALKNSFPTIYSIFLLIFLILFIVSLVFAILLLMPKDIAFKDLPKTFYTDVRQEYLNNGLPENEVKYYVRETYLKQVEIAVEKNFKLNNKKSKYNYWAFKLAIIGIIPYFIAVGFKIIEQQSEPFQVEIVQKLNTNLNKTNMIKNEKNNQNQQTPPAAPEPNIEPSRVIVREPLLIKEGQEKPVKK